MKKLIYLIAALLLLSCGKGSQNMPENFDYGTLENNVYKNRFFKLSVPIHKDWVVQNKEQMQSIVETGSKMMTGDDKNLEAVVEASKINTAYLLTIFKYELGAAVEYNPSFMVIAENISHAPGVKRGSDYLFHTKKLLQQGQVHYTFAEEMTEKTIGTASFDGMQGYLDLMGKKITQDYFTTIKNGFSLSFVATYTNEEEKSEIYDLIDRIKI